MYLRPNENTRPRLLHADTRLLKHYCHLGERVLHAHTGERQQEAPHCGHASGYPLAQEEAGDPPRRAPLPSRLGDSSNGPIIGDGLGDGDDDLDSDDDGDVELDLGLVDAGLGDGDHGRAGGGRATVGSISVGLSRKKPALVAAPRAQVDHTPAPRAPAAPPVPTEAYASAASTLGSRLVRASATDILSVDTGSDSDTDFDSSPAVLRLRVETSRAGDSEFSNWTVHAAFVHGEDMHTVASQRGDSCFTVMRVQVNAFSWLWNDLEFDFVVVEGAFDVVEACGEIFDNAGAHDRALNRSKLFVKLNDYSVEMVPGLKIRTAVTWSGQHKS
ncbi:hypothetical protein ON010_g4042 [Phytophthora cinnamomi]|nr:hypothetical protein ON010_g4042 [Phytophthora cinnamomi]